MNQKFIALDLGGVCVKLRHTEFFAQLGLDSFTPELLAIHNSFEKGKISQAEWLFGLRSNCVALSEFSDEQFLVLFSDIIGVEMPGMSELVSLWVEKGYEIVIFSNTSDLHAEVVLQRISFADKISAAVYSFEAAYMKPEPEIYHYFEEKYGRPVFYLDDNEDNIEQGRAMGWNAKLFKNAQELLEEEW
jgi:FMN phosphatase YigB (HAD superfamily)